MRIVEAGFWLVVWIAFFGGLMLFFAGCTLGIPALAAGGDPLAVMREQNGRGCVYARVSASFGGSGSVLVVGTWGPDPPPYEACWTGLPMLAP